MFNTWFCVCVLVVGFVVLKVVCDNELKNITVGYLTVDKRTPWQRDTQGRLISGAISYAIDLINNDTSVLSDYFINLIWGDTNGNTINGTKLLLDQWRKGAVAFFGLEDSCSVEARVAAAVNLPMLSYVSILFFIMKLFTFSFGHFEEASSQSKCQISRQMIT